MTRQRNDLTAGRQRAVPNNHEVDIQFMAGLLAADIAPDGEASTMTVTALNKDPKAFSTTLSAEFVASPARAWRMLAMGTEEGLREAVGQIDEILAETAIAHR